MNTNLKDERYSLEVDKSTPPKPLPWFRFYTEFVTDQHIRILSPTDQLQFVRLLCLKGSGVLDKAYPSEEVRIRILCRHLEVSPKGWRSLTERLVKANLCSSDGLPLGWDKRQCSSDLSTERMRRHRLNTKCDGVLTVTSPSLKRSGDGLDVDVDVDVEGERDKKSQKTSARSAKLPALRAAANGDIPLLLNDGTETALTPETIAQYQSLYPGVSVAAELRSMAAWLLSNPGRRKTRSGILRYVGSWLSREQNRSRENGGSPHAPDTYSDGTPKKYIEVP